MRNGARVRRGIVALVSGLALLAACVGDFVTQPAQPTVFENGDASPDATLVDGAPSVVAEGGVPVVVDVSLGGAMNCAVVAPAPGSAGDVWCWGYSPLVAPATGTAPPGVPKRVT